MEEGTCAFAAVDSFPSCLPRSARRRSVSAYSHYVVDEFSWDGNWFNVYTGGGLIDLRKIEASARADGDSVLGIAKIWEAFEIGAAADWWGDIPYSDAVGSDATPTLDSQAAVMALPYTAALFAAASTVCR